MFQHEIRQYRLHQRLVDQPPLKGGPPAHPPVRLGQGGAHQAGRRHRRVQAGVVDHVDDGLDAATFGPQALGPGAVIFDFRRGIRPVAQLVLQAHEMDGVALAVSVQRGTEEAGQARTQKAIIAIGDRYPARTQLSPQS